MSTAAIQKKIAVIYDGKVFRPEKPPNIRPNTRCTMTVEFDDEAKRQPDENAWNVLEGLIGAVEGPVDWSREHDHYLYGTSKRPPRSGT